MISKRKNKSTDDTKKIGIFVESPRFLSYSIHLGRDTETVVVTNSKQVYDKIPEQGISKCFLPDKGIANLLTFKKKFKALAVENIILFSDSSPVSFWIQKRYKTLMVSEDFIFGRGDLHYLLLPSNIKKCGFGIRILQKIAGSKSLFQGKTVYYMPNRIYQILLFMMLRLVFGFRENFFTHPGRYATKISVFSDAYKAVYLDNGISADRVIVNGSISFESSSVAIDNFKFNSSNYTAVDVVLFAQPFYKYPEPRKGTWITEIRSFVEDCQKLNASYLVALHPRDDIEFYLKFVPKECIVVAPRTEEQNIALVKAAKLVVLKQTTTIVLPILLKKPVAYLNYSSYSEINMMKHFQKEMVLYHQNRVSDMISFLDENLKSVVAHQDNEVRLMCASIRGVKERIITLAKTLE